MDGHGFDRFARSLVAPGSRRRLLAAWCGATLTAVAAAVGFAKRPTDAQTCAAEDEPCQLWNPCCAGLVCAASPLNPNNGVCVPGELRTVPESDPGDGREPRPTNTPNPTKTPKPTKTPSPDRTPKPTKTPESNKRASLKVRLRCQSAKEELEIQNTGESAVTVERIKVLSSSSKQGKYEVNVDRLLPAGATLLFTSAKDAPDKAIRQIEKELFPNDGDNPNSVEVTTSGGTFGAACTKGRRKTGENLRVTVVCGRSSDAEKTTIENLGSKTVKIKTVARINVHPDENTISPGPNNEKQLFSGPVATEGKPNTLSKDRIYGPDPPVNGTYIEWVVTEAGNRFPAKCVVK